jgi:SWI/SNF-related matrix-associated actin-dependent regulator 1 of chromatin subfamily A
VPPDTVAILGPPSSKHYKAEWTDAHSKRWVVCSYDLSERALELAFGEEAPDLLILDEGHLLGGRKTKRSERITYAASLSRYRLLVTGTPMWSRPRDFWKPLSLVLGRRFGSSWDFDHRYCNVREGEFGGLDNSGSSNEEELKLRLGYYMVRRLKEDVLKELPPLTRQILWIDGDKAGQRAFQAAQLKHNTVNLQNALAATGAAKTEVALQLARDAKKFLLFTYRRADARSLARRLEQTGTPCVCITGDDPVEVRNALSDEAVAKGWGVVATLDSLSVGVNLQGVGHIGIMHTMDYTPNKMLQGESRLHRLGQVDAVLWYYLACKDTMDEIIIETIVNKLESWTAIMGKDQGNHLRDKLNAAIGVGEQAEQDALRAIYAAMGDDT